LEIARTTKHAPIYASVSGAC